MVVSPYIPKGTVDHTVYDHASTPATVSKMSFARGDGVNTLSNDTGISEASAPSDQRCGPILVSSNHASVGEDRVTFQRPTKRGRFRDRRVEVGKVLCSPSKGHSGYRSSLSWREGDFATAIV